MNYRLALIHAAICTVLGLAIAAATPMKWFAAALLISAALQLNGALAFYEDGQPGGFDNPDGTETPSYAHGWGAAIFWVKAVATAGSFAAAGLCLQFA